MGRQHRRRHDHGADDGEREGRTDPRRCRELGDITRRPDLDVPSSRSSMVRWAAGDGGRLRVRLAAHSRSEDSIRLRLLPPLDEERGSNQHRQDARNGARRHRARRQDARRDAGASGTLPRRVHGPCRDLPGAAPCGRGERCCMGESRKLCRQRRLYAGRVDSERSRHAGEESALLRRREREGRPHRVLSRRWTTRRRSGVFAPASWIPRAVCRRARSTWLRANMPDVLSVAPVLTTEFLAVNQTKKPFDDKRVREALNLALDREALTVQNTEDGRDGRPTASCRRRSPTIREWRGSRSSPCRKPSA